MNKAALRKELMELSPAERIELAMELWDSVESEAFSPLTDEEKADLDRRLDELEKNPTMGSPWEDVKARLLTRHR
jgi:putative addiction module component (TIGR02574 family)